MILFIQQIQSLVFLKRALLVKSNIATSLQKSAFKWYISELDDHDCNTLNKESGVKKWITTLSQRFKMPTSIALGLLTSESYFLEDAQRHRPLTQYVRAIMRHRIGCNIVDVPNQLSFAYKRLAPKLRVFVSPPTESTKASDFIWALKEKQEVWYNMLSIQTPFSKLPFHMHFNAPAIPLSIPKQFRRGALFTQFKAFSTSLNNFTLPTSHKAPPLLFFWVQLKSRIDTNNFSRKSLNTSTHKITNNYNLSHANSSWHSQTLTRKILRALPVSHIQLTPDQSQGKACCRLIAYWQQPPAVVIFLSHVSYTNQVHPIVAIKKSTKKDYIRLTRT